MLLMALFKKVKLIDVLHWMFLQLFPFYFEMIELKRTLSFENLTFQFATAAGESTHLFRSHLALRQTKVY